MNSVSPVPQKDISPVPQYAKLEEALMSALRQASEGKGKERHATGEPFEEQKICVMARWLAGSKVAGVLFQAAKKVFETAGFERDDSLTEAEKVFRQVRELRGAINYIAAALILLGERETGPLYDWKNVGASFNVALEDLPRSCEFCFYQNADKLDTYPCKKCFKLPFKPHFTATGPVRSKG